MLRKIEEKHCLTCGNTVKGRSDKKFCDDYCRNTYNNQLNADANAYVRNINSILRKNRRILEDLLLDNTHSQIAKRESLLQYGFNFHYYTHTTFNPQATESRCCYEYGYTQIDAETYSIFKTAL